MQNKDLALLPGMYVQAEFALKPANIVQVPASAMLFRTGGPQVVVVDATGTARFKDVTIGRDNGNFVEIASGLAEGDRVVLNINSQIADGDQVTVRDDKTDGQ
jgi:membrane fusion protein, multidrug efflux system